MKKRHWTTRYIVNILVAIDQLFNAILLGDADETISSRLGKILRDNRTNWAARLICRLLDFLQLHHCEKAIEPDEGDDAIVS